MATTNPPTRTLAGISTPYTPLVTASIAFARVKLNDMSYNHIMRSFLLGFAVSDKLPHLSTTRDKELHAIAAILHDQGWDITGSLVSKDKRFEVDSANAARDFIASQTSDWDKHRLQVLWDAIALHATPSIAMHKEPEVVAAHLGIMCDVIGWEAAPKGTLTQEQWDQVVREFPRTGMKEGFLKILCGLCRTKPETTYDNWVGDVGEKLGVEGYSREGRTVVDLMVNIRDF
jgi:hypothetical protein